MDDQLKRNQNEGGGCFSSSLDQCEDREEGVSPSEARLCGGDEGQRVALQSSEVPSGPSAQQHQPQLDSIFQLLEENIVSFVKTELKKIQKVLSPDGSESLWKEDDDDDEEQRSSREALMKMILNFLRRMKQEELAERLHSNVQQMLPVKMEAPEETSHDVVLQVPESSLIKQEVEEVLIGQEEKQLCVKEESSTASCPVSTTSIKSEDDAETPLFSQLHEHLKEEDDCPTNRSNHQKTGIITDNDSGKAESTCNPNLNTGVEISNSSETEDTEDEEKYKNVNHPNCEPKRSKVEVEPFDKRQKSHSGQHRKIYTRKKKFSCDFCEYSCSDRSNLVVHRRIHTGERPFRCDLCGLGFKKSTHLHRHKTIHTGEKPFHCDLCGHSFRQSSHLDQHKRTHTGEKPFRCDICGHSFGHKANLSSHRKIHTGEKPFRCDICGHRFNHKHKLSKHRKIHTGEKPISCDVCGHRFRDKSDLTKHSRIHTGEKPYCCDLCGRCFVRKSYLEKHRRIHTGFPISPNL